MIAWYSPSYLPGLARVARRALHVAVLASFAIQAGIIPATLAWNPIREAPSSGPPSAAAAAMPFIENTGQFAPAARFVAYQGGMTLWLADDALWLTLLNSGGAGSGQERSRPGQATLEPRTYSGANLRVTFVGANRHPLMQPFGRLPMHVFYLLGRRHGPQPMDAPVWAGVRYVEIYPHIDLELAGPGGTFSPRLILHHGARLAGVTLQIAGARTVTLAGETARLHTPNGDAVLPLLTMAAADGPQMSPPAPVIAGDEIHTPFRSQGEAATAHPPATNPALVYSSYLGGSGDDQADAVAVDGAGNAYVTGETTSTNFPVTPGAFQGVSGGGSCGQEACPHAFVARVNTTGTALMYATYLGGTTGADAGIGIAVDRAGHAYITGETESRDFPVTAGAYQPTYGGGGDAFVAELDSTGGHLLYGTYLGGRGLDAAYGIAVDGHGDVYVTGVTSSTDFPTTQGAVQRICGCSSGSGSDAFVARLRPGTGQMGYATYLGGHGQDAGSGIAVDTAGNTYLTGFTNSRDFPVTPGVFQTRNNGGDAFVAKLNHAGTALIYATYLGGSGADWGNNLAIDGTGQAHIIGVTNSDDFPITSGAIQRTLRGQRNAFVTTLSPDATTLTYATYLGGSGSDSGYGIAVGGDGSTYVTGQTSSSDFPITTGALQTKLNGTADAFIVHLTAGGLLAYGTYLGGGNRDGGTAIAVIRNRQALVTGATRSPDFPVTPGALQTRYGGGLHGGDAFVTRLTLL